MAKLEFVLNGSIDEIAGRALGGRQTAKFMAERAEEYIKPYIPRDTGFLADSAEINEDGGGFFIEYTAPYAEEQYYFAGERNSKNPLASSYWDKAAMEFYYASLVKDVEGRIKGNG